MESIIVLGILTSGYYFSKKKNSNLYNEKVLNNDEITYNDVVNYELEKNTENHNNSKDPKNTNIIPEDMNEQIINEDKYNNSSVFSSLTGTTMTKENFKHNNMVPFFKGSTAPGDNFKNKEQIMERFVGNSDFELEKKEREPLFVPEKDFTNINGYTKNIDDMKSRINVSNIRTSELPFEQEKVGPGLDSGYTSSPSGGFHPDTRDYALPKNVDQLYRTASRPQVSYDGVVVQGKNVNDKRGKEGDVEKHRPDTFYLNSPDRWNTTVGAFTKETIRPCQIVKDTNRKKSRSFFGPAISDYERHKLKPKFKKSTKNIFTKDWIRNAYADDKWTNIDDNDYGKSGIELPCNERDITTNRTHTLNPQSIVKALFTPLLDEVRRTKKENVIGNIRQSGNVQITGPGNLTVYDPNDVAKTTMKETNIDNKHSGNVGNVQGGDGYLVSSNDAPNTNRQFTGELREPTQVKEKLFVGGDKIELDVKKVEEDYINQSEPKVDKIYNAIPETNKCEITNQKDQLDNNPIADRIESCMVDAFKENPYTKSLHSFS